eukprot:scaffold69668_cov62-Cyclotella_meneghiniana.AAC.2
MRVHREFVSFAYHPLNCLYTLYSYLVVLDCSVVDEWMVVEACPTEDRPRSESHTILRHSGYQALSSLKSVMSTDQCYSARSSTRTQVLDAIKRLTLSKNASEQYNSDDAVKYFAAIKRVLKETYNPGDPGHGMEKLIEENTPGLPREHPTNATSTFTTTAQNVLTQYQQQAAALNRQNLVGQNVLPLITDRTEAQDQADRLNLQNQAVIGAKEGATEGIVLQFGRDVTDSVLKTADGVDFKGIDEYHLYDLVQVCIQGAATSNRRHTRPPHQHHIDTLRLPKEDNQQC